jgi:uncharacterized protein YegL
LGYRRFYHPISIGWDSQIIRITGGENLKANAVTYIGFVQDHSGSMSTNVDLAISNFNEQRATLLKEDDDTMDNVVTVVEFDDQIHCNIENMPISEVKQMESWWTGGMTALYDAIGYCINNIKQKMDADKRTDKAALIVVQTDGHENCSSDYEGEKGRQRINKLINELEETKHWTFVFLGENIDKEVIADMGFKLSNAMSHKKGDTVHAYAATADGLKTYMGTRKAGGTYSMNWYNDGNSNDNDQE